MSAAVRLSDPSVRRSIEDEIERLISMLDLVDGVADLDPALTGGAEVVGTDDREGDASELEYSLGWTTSGTFGLREDLEGNLAGSGADLELADSDYGETAMWSNDPDVRKKGSAGTAISDHGPSDT